MTNIRRLVGTKHDKTQPRYGMTPREALRFLDAHGWRYERDYEARTVTVYATLGGRPVKFNTRDTRVGNATVKCLVTGRGWIHMKRDGKPTRTKEQR